MIRKKLVILNLLLLLSVVTGFSQFVQQGDSLVVTRSDIAFLELFGVSYQRETPIGRKNIFIFNPKIYYDIFYGNGIFGERFGHSLSLGLTVGSRHYYRLKPSFLNSNNGNYIGIDLGIKSAPIVEHNLYFNPILFVSPYWGFRRKVGRKTLIELSLGLNLKKDLGNQSSSSIYVSPAIQFGFGWRL